MKTITKLVESCWDETLDVLKSKVRHSAARVEELLTLEEYYRTGHRDDNLKAAMGSFADGSIDAGALASVLGEGDDQRLMGKKRLERVRRTAQALREVENRLETAPPKCEFASLYDSEADLLDRGAKHLESMSELFKLIRIADLEGRARYEDEHHDGFFKRFGYDHLENEEVSLCPPFVIMADDKGDRRKLLGKLLRVVSAGLPVKVMLVQSHIPKRDIAAGRSAALQCSMDIELLPVALRGIYVAQSAVGAPDLGERLGHGIASPRPAVMSIFVRSDVKEEDYRTLAEASLSSRLYPRFVYDPDRSADFVQCFDLSGNPALDRPWPKASLEFRNEKGETEKLERELTFADFVVDQPDFAEEFSLLPADLEGRTAVHIAEFLAYSPYDRGGKVPFVYTVDSGRRLVKKVPSQAVVIQTGDRQQLWHTLKELAGIENPHVQAAREKLRQDLDEEKRSAMTALRAELAAELEAKRQEAVSGAMRNLAARLTGLAPAEAAEALVAGVAAAVPEAPAAGGAKPKKKKGGDLAWIQSKKCTTCDECININKNIFAYDKNKKAFVKDPKGGSFRDIVKAAKKCSARIIHPGKPQDPNEADLEKWIKEAEPFQ